MIDRFRIAGLLLVVIHLAGCTSFAPPASDMNTVWAEQGWSNDERHWFHHAEQGTSTFGIPFEWLMALEQPHLSLSDPGLLMDQRYLSRFGFIPSPSSVKDPAVAAAYGYSASSRRSKYALQDYNQGNVPVGFAVGGEWVDASNGRTWPLPGSGRNARTIGLTCAACHTGQLEYGGNRILVDGGQAAISLDQFREALTASIAFTRYVPGRFERFAERVLGDGHSDQSKAQLAAQLDAVIEAGKKRAALEKSVADQRVAEGFTRLDALNRIGNQVFSLDMKRPENFYATTAPVSYPFIWNAPWLDWVQYNSSIQQPMVRNVGEAMGVAAPVNLSNPARGLYDSTIPVNTIHEMELLLSGEEHPLEAGRFGGLRSPRWVELPLPPLNQALVAEGRALYMGDPASASKGLCVRCHRPPLDSEKIMSRRYWREPGGGFRQPYLALVTIPVEVIGTDCKTAYDMAYRTVVTSVNLGNSGDLVELDTHPPDCPQPADPPPTPKGTTRTNFGVALGQVVGRTKDAWYDNNGVPTDKRPEMDGFRPNGIRATVNGAPVYKARPLNGVWATPPFLHNGSVPNLYLLLSTQKERDAEAARFYLGSRVFDPRHVGYRYRTSPSPSLPDVPVLADATGLFELDTSIPGNRNTGHLFTDEKVSGRIKRRLSVEERFAIIEFIKSL